MRPVPLLTLLLISATTHAQRDEDRPVEVDARLLDVDRPLGQISGIAVDSQQLLITFHRAGRTWNTLFVLLQLLHPTALFQILLQRQQVQ
jgi:hypothetical protein